MNLNDQRIIYEDDTALNDVSVSLGSFREGEETFEFVTAEDYLYIGSFLPFNHKHFDIGTANSNASVFSIDLWSGSSWDAARDIIDGTSVSGVSLAQDGIIRWTMDRQETWHRELDSFSVSGLESTEDGKEIYDMYWVRMKWSSDLSAGTSLKYTGQKFSKDSELYDLYPDLNRAALKTAYESGKTDWEEQHYLACDAIIRDLRKNNSILSPGQIIDYEIFNEPSIYKTAEIIFQGLGKSYDDRREQARDKYLETFNQNYLRLDIDGNTRLTGIERTIRTGFMTR